MLVLTRRKNQSFTIGDDIKIVVVEIREGSVRIGIQAPDDAEHQIVRPDARNQEPRPNG